MNFGETLAGFYQCSEDSEIGLKGCAFRRTVRRAMLCSGGMVRERIIPPMVLSVLFRTAEAVPFQSTNERYAREFAAEISGVALAIFGVVQDVMEDVS